MQVEMIQPPSALDLSVLPSCATFFGDRPQLQHQQSSASIESQSNTITQIGGQHDVNSSSARRKRPRRVGKVVAVLKQRYLVDMVAYNTAFYNLAPSATSNGLNSNSLQASLNHHLVHVALKTLDPLSQEAWHNIAPLLPRLKRFGLDGSDAYLEAVVACAAALGARTSEHSLITGVTKDQLENKHSNALVLSSLGERREAACMALAGRAIRIVEENDLLSENSPQARALAYLMRAIFSCLLPVHPYSRTLTQHLKHQLRPSRSSPSRNATLLVLYDSLTSFSLFESPVCSDADLVKLGWVNGLPTVEHLIGLPPLAALDDDPRKLVVEVDQRFCDAMIVLTRAFSHLQTAPLLPPEELVPVFGQLSQLVDTLHTLPPVLTKLCAEFNIFEHQTQPFKAPAQAEIALFTQTKRHCRGRSFKLWRIAQSRLLRFLATVARAMAKLDAAALQSHYSAGIFMQFEKVPEWTQLAVDGAVQHAQGEGPLASAAFTANDAASIHRALAFGSTIFAALADREREMGELMLEAGLNEPAAEEVLSAEELAAGRMVELAMSDILAH